MFSSDIYRVKQKGRTLGQKYVVEDPEQVLLETKDRNPDLDEGLLFHDPEGDEVLELREEQKLEVNAPITLMDSEGNVIGGFQRNWGFFSHDWHILNSENRIVGILNQEKRLRSILKKFVSDLFSFSFKLISKEGETVGRITGRFSVLEDFRVEVDKEEIDPRLALALAVVIDIEENS